MNKILVTNDEVTLLESDEKLNVTLSDKFDLFDIVKLNINRPYIIPHLFSSYNSKFYEDFNS